MVEVADLDGPVEARIPGRRRLVVMFLLVLVLLQTATVGAILIAQWTRTEATLLSHIMSVVGGTVNEIREKADGFLSSVEHALQLSRGLSDLGLLSFDDRDRVTQYFLLQLQSVPQIDGMYHATGEGAFLFVKRAVNQPDRPDAAQYMVKDIRIADGRRSVTLSWLDASGQVIVSKPTPLDEYDPRTRPWFTQAINADSVIWTEPYIFFTSKLPGVTAAVAMRKRDTNAASAQSPAGVIGIDVSLGSLSQFLSLQAVSANGSVMVLDRVGQVIASSAAVPQSDTVGETPISLPPFERTSDVAREAFARLHRENSRLGSLQKQVIFHLEDGTSDYLASFSPFLDQQRWPWLIAVLVRKDAYMGDLQRVQQQSAIIAIAMGVLVTLVAFFAGPRLLRPVMVLHDRAVRDSLTGMMNRRSFREAAQSMMTRALDEDFAISVIMLDIDEFKAINDEHGHAAGDDVLRAIAGRMARDVSEHDLIGRLGGEEFALMLCGANRERASIVAERLRSRIASVPIAAGELRIPVTISLGVAECDPSVDTLNAILHKADIALLAAKRAGRNRVRIDGVAATESQSA